MIFSLFLGITQLFRSEETGWEKTGLLLSNLMVTLSFSLNILGFTNILDDAFRKLGDMSTTLQQTLPSVTQDSEKKAMMNLIRDIDKSGPFTGRGYFDITKSTLTAMASVGITYVIILVQFRTSA